MIRKNLCLALVFCMLLTLLPFGAVPARAAGEIDRVILSVTLPQAGQSSAAVKPQIAAAEIGLDPVRPTIEHCSWLGSPDVYTTALPDWTFEAGGTYYILAVLKAPEGYTFKKGPEVNGGIDADYPYRFNGCEVCGGDLVFTGCTTFDSGSIQGDYLRVKIEIRMPDAPGGIKERKTFYSYTMTGEETEHIEKDTDVAAYIAEKKREFEAQLGANRPQDGSAVVEGYYEDLFTDTAYAVFESIAPSGLRFDLSSDARFKGGFMDFDQLTVQQGRVTRVESRTVSYRSVTVAADQYRRVGDVSLVVFPPLAGTNTADLSAEFSVNVPKGQHCGLTDAEWMEKVVEDLYKPFSGTFEAGQTYCLRIEISADKGCAFNQGGPYGYTAVHAAGGTQLRDTLSVTNMMDDQGNISSFGTVMVEFTPKTENIAIETVSLVFTPPEEGAVIGMVYLDDMFLWQDPVPDVAPANDDAGYMLFRSGTEWIDAEGRTIETSFTFTPDGTFRVSAQLRPRPGFAFADGVTAAVANGKNVKATLDGKGVLTVSFAWSGAAGPHTGDVDGNGAIEPADARLALRISLGLMKDGDKVMTDDMVARADVDGKDGVQPGDARLILRKSLGLDVSSDGWLE